ncbi:GLPGLI family protein [Flavobacterium degerlachei]|uniref:GLPGLI family protein n=1 Tax=Flavobacterium degerlachei TaxID=229203 RepID=A0A1H2PY06_9FLAO|nr:GLPGLI family protein [Flavobacterium degerlachei]SDV99736.1 GLPGLI family protein [Flavobacterium degerlachei]
MKSKFLVFTLLFNLFIYAQQKGIIYYGQINALDIGNAKGPDSNAYMVFNKEQSYYVTAKDSLEKVEKLNQESTFENEEGNTRSIHLGIKVSKQGDQVVYNIAKKTMWSNLLYRTQVYIKEVVPEMNWKIEKVTKKIGQFNCQKATTFFRGRNYTAWFCPEISVPFGPWKLHGLPGLILEAYDTNKFISWYFKSVEYPTKNLENVKYMSIPHGISIKNYNEFLNFQKEQQIKTIEKNRMAQKQFPNATFNDPIAANMFLEFQ